MGFIEYLKNLFCGADIKRLEDSLDAAIEELDAVHFDLGESYDRYEILKSDYEILKEPDQSKPPCWLDQSRGNHNPSVLVFEKNKSYWVQIDPIDIYAPSPSLEKLVTDKKWRGLPLNQRVVSIWRHVIDHIKYRYDQSESWEYPTTTHYRKYGDCEDGTIYFLTLCRLAKVPGDRVFNAVGKMGSVGHSWPIVQMEDDKWYIMETTLDHMPEQPMLFDGSKYHANYGVYNWKFKGGIDNAQRQV